MSRWAGSLRGAANPEQASAYTVGDGIVSGPGRPAPATPGGRLLVAHELAHVIRQRRGGPGAAASMVEGAGRAVPDVALGRRGLSTGGIQYSVHDGKLATYISAERDRRRDVQKDPVSLPHCETCTGGLAEAGATIGEDRERPGKMRGLGSPEAGAGRSAPQILPRGDPGRSVTGSGHPAPAAGTPLTSPATDTAHAAPASGAPQVSPAIGSPHPASGPGAGSPPSASSLAHPSPGTKDALPGPGPGVPHVLAAAGTTGAAPATTGIQPPAASRLDDHPPRDPAEQIAPGVLRRGKTGSDQGPSAGRQESAPVGSAGAAWTRLVDFVNTAEPHGKPAGTSQEAGSGKPLPDGGAGLSARFGPAAAGILVHTGPVAAAAADRLHASAFTVGRHVIFGAGRFDPTSVAGQLLLAHEMAHVMQQRNSAAGGGAADYQVGAQADAGAELEADQAAANAVLGLPIPALTPTRVAVACQDKAADSGWRARLWHATTEAVAQARTQARDYIKGSVGVVEGVANEAATIVDTVVWAESKASDLTDALTDKVATAAGLSDSKRELLKVAVGVATNRPAVQALREVARKADLIDPKTGHALSTAELVRTGFDKLDKVLDETLFRGVPKEEGLLTSRDIGVLTGAIGSQVALAFVGAEEVQLALRAVGAVGAVQSIVTTIEANPKGWEIDPNFWTGVIGLALSVIGIGESSAGKKILGLLLNSANTLLTTIPAATKLAHDYLHANGPDRDEKLREDIKKLVTALAQAIQQIVAHARAGRGGKAGAPAEGGQAAPEPGGVPTAPAPAEPAAPAPAEPAAAPAPERPATTAPPSERPASVPTQAPAPPVSEPPAAIPSAAPEPPATTPTQAPAPPVSEPPAATPTQAPRPPVSEPPAATPTSAPKPPVPEPPAVESPAGPVTAQPGPAPPDWLEPTAPPQAVAGAPAGPAGAQLGPAPPDWLEPTAHPPAGDVKSRRVPGLQSSGEISRQSPKPGTLTGLEPTAHPDTAKPRLREVTGEEQLYGIPSSEDWRKTRGATPTSQLQAEAQKALPVGSVDPAFPSLKVTGTAQADHIVSVDRIRKMPGFANLDAAAQREVLNHPDNFIALSPAANQSKGGKSFKDWTHSETLGLPVDPKFRSQMIAREAQVERAIQERIGEHIRAGRVTWPGGKASAELPAPEPPGAAPPPQQPAPVPLSAPESGAAPPAAAPAPAPESPAAAAPAPGPESPAAAAPAPGPESPAAAASAPASESPTPAPTPTTEPPAPAAAPTPESQAPVQTPTAAPPAAAQKPAAPTVAPNVETEMGMTTAQRGAVKGAFSGNLTSPANAPLGAVWDKVAVPGQAATLTPANSRGLFDNHRDRFWRAVRQDPAALKAIRDMGGSFPEERSGGKLDLTKSTAPEINLPGGTRLRISLDHEVERQTAPNLALDPNNLRLSTIRENTVLLRQLHEQDPFINPPPGWTPSP
jgi:hypothetical protein